MIITNKPLPIVKCADCGSTDVEIRFTVSFDMKSKTLDFHENENYADHCNQCDGDNIVYEKTPDEAASTIVWYLDSRLDLARELESI